MKPVYVSDIMILNLPATQSAKATAR